MYKKKIGKFTVMMSNHKFFTSRKPVDQPAKKLFINKLCNKVI